jgi:hypothetical protein
MDTRSEKEETRVADGRYRLESHRLSFLRTKGQNEELEGIREKTYKKLQTSHLPKFPILLEPSNSGVRYPHPTSVRKFAKSENSSKFTHTLHNSHFFYSTLVHPLPLLFPASCSLSQRLFCSHTIFLRSLKPKVKKLWALWGG